MLDFSSIICVFWHIRLEIIYHDMEHSVLYRSAPRAETAGEGQGADEPSRGDETEPDTGRNCVSSFIPTRKLFKLANCNHNF